MTKTVIFGYPGTGKTYKLMQILEKIFEEGTEANRVCFCTYTRSAADVAKERAMNKFNLKKEDMTYFGTIHSLCFRRFCVGKELVKPSHLGQFFKVKNLEYQESYSDEDLLVNETFGDEVGNKLINFYNLVRITECKGIDEISGKDELKQIFHNRKINEENFVPIFVNVFDPYKILVEYEKYKQDNNLIDYTDMLLIAYKSKWIVPTDILFVDEAQDLSPIQWAIYDNWCQDKKQIFLAGDDDQSIYGFNGATPKRLMSEKEIADNVEILTQTWRLNKNIHDYCFNYINNNIRRGNRVVKEVIAVKPGGEVIEESIDRNLERVKDFIRKDKTTYILFRTNSYKKQFISEILVPNGILYWEIRGQSIWNNKTINLFNALVKLSKKEEINSIETEYLIDSISSTFKLIKRGLKSKFKDMPKKEKYSNTDLIELGFDMNFFSYINNFKILNMLKISDSLKGAFLSRPKEHIEYPLKLFVGTMHSSKGKEADDVIIFKDISKRIAREVTKSNEDWENEIRVFHVAQTRAKERLIILRGGFDYAESDLIP